MLSIPKLNVFILIYLSGFLAHADKLVFLDTPQKSLQARVDYLQKVQTEVRAQYFTAEDDPVSKSSLALVREMVLKNPNLKVKIIIDEKHNFLKNQTIVAFLKTSAAKNIQIKEYNKFKFFSPYRYTYRMHDKAFIIDDLALITGGRNIANGYFGLKHINPDDKELDTVFEDTDTLVLNSPAIKTAITYFDNLWNSSFVSPVNLSGYSEENLKDTYCKDITFYSTNGQGSLINYDSHKTEVCEKQRKAKLDKIAQVEKQFDAFIESFRKNNELSKATPFDWESVAVNVEKIEYLYDNPINQSSKLIKPKDGIAEKLYAAVRKASKSVTIVTPYYVITPEQEQIYIDLEKAHVKVHIITNGADSNNSNLSNLGYNKTKELALKHGVEIWEYNGPDTLHAKMVLIDKEKLFVGSFNWDFRSQNLNRENGILATIPTDAQNTLTHDVYMKIARLYLRSTKLGDAKKINDQIGNLSDKDISKLMQEVKAGNKDNVLWKLLFPILKYQI